jgi:hypothetical protein
VTRLFIVYESRNISKGYKVFYGTSASLEDQQAWLSNPSDASSNVPPADATSVDISGLNPDTTYYVTVIAFNDAGDSAPATISGTTEPTNFAADSLAGGLGVDEDNNNGYNDPGETPSEISDGFLSDTGKIFVVDTGTTKPRLSGVDLNRQHWRPNIAFLSSVERGKLCFQSIKLRSSWVRHSSSRRLPAGAKPSIRSSFRVTES